MIHLINCLFLIPIEPPAQEYADDTHVHYSINQIWKTIPLKPNRVQIADCQITNDADGDTGGDYGPHHGSIHLSKYPYK